jgi:ribonuclease HIII
MKRIVLIATVVLLYSTTMSAQKSSTTETKTTKETNQYVAEFLKMEGTTVTQYGSRFFRNDVKKQEDFYNAVLKSEASYETRKVALYNIYGEDYKNHLDLLSKKSLIIDLKER